MAGDEALPFELKVTLRAGTVYYFIHRETTSTEPHYFIILNRDPQHDRFLLTTIASSQIDNVRRRRRDHPPETLVEISPGEFGEFTKPTIVDCNRVFDLGRSELVLKFRSGDPGETAGSSTSRSGESHWGRFGQFSGY